VRLAQSPRALSSPVPHLRCAEFGQLWLNPIMSNMYEIADTLTQMDYPVSARLVGHVLADYGLSKKNG